MLLPVWKGRLMASLHWRTVVDVVVLGVVGAAASTAAAAIAVVVVAAAIVTFTSTVRARRGRSSEAVLVLRLRWRRHAVVLPPILLPLVLFLGGVVAAVDLSIAIPGAPAAIQLATETMSTAGHRFIVQISDLLLVVH